MEPVRREVGRVVLAVLTYQRPADLPELLPQLAGQLTTIDVPGEVLVVDNDAARSAESTVASLSLPSVRYVCEPTPGIAAARNRALDESRDAHLLVFIDDDERPSPGWLEALVSTYRREGCAAVAGSVIPLLDVIDDPWISAGEFFVRKRHPSGMDVDAASTANLLLDLRQLDALGGIRFDERFSLTGGSDTLFTRTLTARGGRIVWCDEATVTDHIRVQRLTRQWVLQRHFRAGNSWARTSVDLAGAGPARWWTRLSIAGHGVARVVLGTLRTAYGVVTRSLRHQARGSRTVARGVGMLSGATGVVYVEYRRGRQKA
jgi:glycosyltransferase involved in cell wall biosynthesis